MPWDKWAPVPILLVCWRRRETDGIYLGANEQSPENVMAGMDKINDLTNQQEYTTGFQQPEKFLGKALEYLKANS